MNTHAVMQRARDTYDLERSPSSRKKQRLSSPTYDLQYDLSQDQLQAFDELDQALTQRKRRSLSPRPSAPPSQAITPRSRRRRTIAIAMALKENVQDDVAGKAHAAPSPTVGSNPAPKAAGFQSAASLAELPRSKYSGFGSALHIAPENTSTLDPPSSSPDPPPEPDLAAWFASSDVPTGLAGFSSAKAVVEHQNEDWFTAPAPAGALGFKSAKSIHAPGDTEGHSLSVSHLLCH
ncbi:hypothetical protein BDW22DRAFT_74345 [Trametopsis cervina]|nr:hypothetical protein BDW22DRAFT_74345 [Trametopsis cervina]